MIPLTIPPLTNITVLVTRPADQAGELCERIGLLGGHAILLPTLAIEPCATTPTTQAHELLVFTSVNAVKHGLTILKSQFELSAANGTTPIIATLGAATTAALVAHGYRVDITSVTSNSEGLLMAAELQTPPKHVLIVRGQGGRELLRETLTQRGSTVNVAEVYTRVAAHPEPARLEETLRALHNGELDVVTATSSDTLLALDALLTPADRDLIHQLTLLAGSPRISDAARAAGWRGECVVSASPADAELLDTLVRWHTRARN